MERENEKFSYLNDHDNDCVLYDRSCILCGECDFCDLDRNKTCDNCGACLNSVDSENEIRVYFDENSSGERNESEKI